jgi:hypothetical protein
LGIWGMPGIGCLQEDLLRSCTERFRWCGHCVWIGNELTVALQSDLIAR